MQITIDGHVIFGTNTSKSWIVPFAKGDFTVAQYNSASTSDRRLTVVGELSGGLIACYNTENNPWGSNTYGNHYISPFTIESSYNLKVDYNRPNSPGRVLNLYLENTRYYTLSNVSGTTAQISVCVIVETTDNKRFFIQAIYDRTGTANDLLLFDENISAFCPQGSPTMLLGDYTISSLYLTDSTHKPEWQTVPDSFITATQDWLNGVTPTQDETDPFAPGGIADQGGGDGDFTPHGEDITDPEIPDVDAVATGFITLFNPSVSELNSLASYMWSGGFDVNTFKKLFANPMDCILGLSILPKIVPNGGSATVLVGNISTGISMTKAARQYIKYDCGSITISRFSNSFLDYEPYTKIHLYLPFIGMHQISTDDVMNKTVQVKYTVDILSGACVAFVIAGGTTLYTFIGQCAASVPITGQDWSTMINGVLGAVGSVASVAGSIATGNIAGAIGGAASMAQNVMGSKPSIEHSGNMGGMGGMLGIKTPYVIIERPAQAIPAKQNAFIGYPSFVTKNFSDLQGYNEVYSTHLENIPATEAELNEIESLLKSGVIF